MPKIIKFESRTSKEFATYLKPYKNDLGYIIQLRADILVENVDGDSKITFRTHDPIFNIFENYDMEPPIGYSKTMFKYLNTWTPITPKGYSSMIIPPIGDNNPLLKIMPQTVDTDKRIPGVLLSLWVRNDFEGIIEKGTPLAQIIPYKRESWTDIYLDPDNKRTSIKDKLINKATKPQPLV